MTQRTRLLALVWLIVLVGVWETRVGAETGACNWFTNYTDCDSIDDWVFVEKAGGCGWGWCSEMDGYCRNLCWDWFQSSPFLEFCTPYETETCTYECSCTN